jgi:hypothetical protein
MLPAGGLGARREYPGAIASFTTVYRAFRKKENKSLESPEFFRKTAFQSSACETTILACFCFCNCRGKETSSGTLLGNK